MSSDDGSLTNAEKYSNYFHGLERSSFKAMKEIKNSKNTRSVEK